MKRKTFTSAVATLAVALAAPTVSAAPCSDTVATGCTVGEIYVIDPKDLVDGSTCTSPAGAVPTAVPSGVCTAYKLKTTTADVLAAVPVDIRKSVDEVILWSGEFKVDGWTPTFYRNGAVNRTDGIGLPKAEPTSADGPVYGHFTAGTTSVLNNDNLRDKKIDCAGGACANDFYTPLDAVAQAAALIYAPYVVGTDPKHPLSVSRGWKPDPAMPNAVANPLVNPAWNFYLDLKSSLLGGNSWRNNGNKTVQSAPEPLPLYGVVTPWNGVRMLRFAPIDLYLMGLMSRAELMAQQPTITSYADAPYVKGDPAVDNDFAARKKDVILQAVPKTLNVAEQIPVDRVPEFAAAPRQIRQAWVLLAKPNVDAGAVRSAAEKLEAQRRQFGSYYYTLTEHRGRIITRLDGADDTGHFDFVSDVGDATGATFDQPEVGGGLTVKAIVREGANDSDPARTTYLRATTTAGGFLRLKGFGGKGLALSSSDFNVVVVRLRTSVPDASARVSLNGGALIDVPGAGVTLIADGAFHDYGVDLAKAQITGPINSITLEPLSKTGDVDVDRIRLAKVDSKLLVDSDAKCVVPGALNTKVVPDPDGIIDAFDNCPALSNKDQMDTDGNGRGDACEDSDSDGIPDSCDNCVFVGNESQADGDKNGTGDRCEPGRDDRAACFLRPYSIGGAVRGGPGVIGFAAVAGLLFAHWRRRRRG